MSRPCQAIIKKSALLHNYNVVKTAAPESAVIAMIKADAYGHGLSNIAVTLDKADAFGVACLEEALVVREVVPDSRIVLMEGVFDSSEYQLVSAKKLECVIHCEKQIELLEKLELENPIGVWLKVNTGMNRLGVDVVKAESLWHRLQKCKNVISSPKIMTHFAEADVFNSINTKNQINVFNKLLSSIKCETSLANSAAIISLPETHRDWVRPGIMLYGISPFLSKSAPELGLQAVMTFKSKIIAIQDCKSGDKIGYGGDWICKSDTRIGVIAAGYGDGYPRHVKSGTPVLVNGELVSLVGRVSMDMITVDLGSQAQAKIGDPAVLWGDGLPVEKIAECADTIPYELICTVTSRVPRIYCN